MFLAASLLALTACDKQANTYPALLPTAQVLAEPVLPTHSTDAITSPESVDTQAKARADALRDRAQALKKPVIDAETRARMQKNQ
ncbi:hypothetical protein H4P12_04365 [Paracoccus sp. 11-3]|uniref:Uncharacterized protein n=1 Tax=Paracoccus amoyensis TaxID=2760093 RepID=A0A926JCN4_9RHOB|nr:hypothetical protein [Paracoccus amoyensis]